MEVLGRVVGEIFGECGGGEWWGRIVREQGVAQAGGGEQGCKPTLVGDGERI